MKEIIVGNNEAGQRMDKLLAKVLTQCSKSFLYKMLRKKNIKLNSQKAEGREILKEGDTIQIYFSDETFAKFSKKDPVKSVILPEQFQVLYEDNDIVIMNKWAGVLSQKAKETDISMNDYFLAYLLQQGTVNQEMLKTFTPSICNRLDRNTTGLLIGGASFKGLQVMAKALKERTVDKYYYAFVKGEVLEGKHVKGYLQKEETDNVVRILTEKEAFSHGVGTPIETEYKVVCHSRKASLLKVHLITGKTHQIRAHLASLGHPIAGDRKYGDAHFNQQMLEQFGVNHQLLHAKELVFADDMPLTQLAGKVVQAPLPKTFAKVAKECFPSGKVEL